MSPSFLIALTMLVVGMGIGSGLHHLHGHWFVKVALSLYAIAAGLVLGLAWRG